MKIYKHILALLLSVAAVSCSKPAEVQQGEGRRLTFTASFDLSPDGESKVVRNEQGKSEWRKGDQIKIFYDDDDEWFVTATAQSDGYTTTFVTDEEIPEGYTHFIAAYPACRCDRIECDGSAPHTEDDIIFNYNKSGIAATFDNAALCSAEATSDNMTFVFRNRCAILKFTTTSNKIHSATFISGSNTSYGVVGTQAIGYKAGDYYLPVPVGENQTFSLRLKDYTGWDYPALVKGPVTLERSHLYNLGTIENILFAENTKASSSMKVMAFNILRGDLGGSGHLWADRKEACLAMLQAQSPQILGLVECTSTQRRDILTEFPEFGAVGVAVSGSVYDYATTSSNPIFYDGTRYVMEKYGTFWLSDTPTTAGSYTWYYNKPRTMTWAQFKLKGENAHFVYVSVHLQDNKSDIDSTHKGHESDCGQENRAKAVNLIKSKLAEINPTGYPVILGGDMNSAYDSYELSNFSGVLSFCAEIAQSTDKGSTFNGFKEGSSRIDHIFSSNCFVRSFAVDRSTYKGVTFISDHWPVYAELTLRYSSEREFDSSLQDWEQDNIQ